MINELATMLVLLIAFMGLLACGLILLLITQFFKDALKMEV